MKIILKGSHKRNNGKKEQMEIPPKIAEVDLRKASFFRVTKKNRSKFS